MKVAVKWTEEALTQRILEIGRDAVVRKHLRSALFLDRLSQFVRDIITNTRQHASSQVLVRRWRRVSNPLQRRLRSHGSHSINTGLREDRRTIARIILAATVSIQWQVEIGKSADVHVQAHVVGVILACGVVPEFSLDFLTIAADDGHGPRVSWRIAWAVWIAWIVGDDAGCVRGRDGAVAETVGRDFGWDVGAGVGLWHSRRGEEQEVCHTHGYKKAVREGDTTYAGSQLEETDAVMDNASRQDTCSYKWERRRVYS
jgi:hypothetical protein